MALKTWGFVRLLWTMPLLLAGAEPALAKATPKPAAGVKAIAAAKDAEATATSAPKPLVQDYAPRPAIWLLEDQDTKIYLLGTIHVLPTGFKWRSPALEQSVRAADELVVVTYSTPEQDEALNAETVPLMMLSEPRPFLKRFPKKHRASIREGIEASGLPAKSLDHMQTWAGGIMIGMAGLLEEFGADGLEDVPGVEDILEAEFKAANKPILSIEDAISVLRSISALPEEVQIAMLVGESESGAAGASAETEDEAASEKDLHDWARGRSENLADDILGGLPPQMYDVLVTRCNAAWTDWLAARLEKPGTVLVAVGAGHLAGKDSLQTMLAARGLAAKRID